MEKTIRHEFNNCRKLQNEYRNENYRYDKLKKAEKILENRILEELTELTPNILDDMINNLYTDIESNQKKYKKRLIH